MENTKNVWTALFTMVALGAFLFFNFTYPIFSPSRADAAESGPIKIGFIAPTTGNFAQLGIDMNDGARLFLESVNNTIAGRKIEVIYEDEGPGPDQAVTKARKLIKHDKVDMVAGVFMTSCAYAVAPICIEAGVPLLITLSSGDDLTQRKGSKWVSRSNVTGCEIGHVTADYAYKVLGWRKTAALGMDYQYGHEHIGAFLALFEELGGKVISRQFAPVTTLDFGPYIAKIPREADGLCDVVSGAASIRFLSSLRQSGLMEKMPVMTVGTAVDESFLQQIGETALGVFSGMAYTVSDPNPENLAFLELCQKKLKRAGSYGMSTSWIGFAWIAKTIEALNGNVEDKEKLAKALRETELKTSIRGPLKMDMYGQVMETFYIRKVEKVGKLYQNTNIASYPGVHQFWPWDAKKILSQPVYSREYPPCKYCK